MCRVLKTAGTAESPGSSACMEQQMGAGVESADDGSGCCSGSESSFFLSGRLPAVWFGDDTDDDSNCSFDAVGKTSEKKNVKSILDGLSESPAASKDEELAQEAEPTDAIQSAPRFRLANAFRASTIPERQMDAIKAMRAITAISAPREKPRRAEIEFSWRRTRLRGEPPEQGPRLLVSRRVLIVKKARAIKGEATDDAELSPELRAVGVVISFRSSISPVKANVMFHELRAGLRSFGGVVASSAAYSSRSQAIGKIRLLRFDHAVVFHAGHPGLEANPVHSDKAENLTALAVEQASYICELRVVDGVDVSG
eukprot:s316_g6.t1